MVEKIECKNHLLKNLCNKLRDLARKSKLRDIDLRKKNGKIVKRMREGITAISYQKSSTDVLPQKNCLTPGRHFEFMSLFWTPHTLL